MPLSAINYMQLFEYEGCVYIKRESHYNSVGKLVATDVIQIAISRGTEWRPCYEERQWTANPEVIPCKMFFTI